MSIEHETIGNLVAQDYRRATVFKRHGIDFCCGGGKTLESVCASKGLSVDDLKGELAQAENRTHDDSIRPSGWSADFLADYIVNQHHAYVRDSLPLLKEFSRKVSRVHGHANPEVTEIDDRVQQLSAELLSHMQKEEMILFPYVKELVNAEKNGGVQGRPAFGTVQNPIRMMEEEHDHAGSLMREIRALSSDYTPPEHACNTYRVLYAKLEEFEEDLHRHIHLENNVLFPKALELENTLVAA